MTSEQAKTYERQKAIGFEFEYTDSDGRIHMTKWEWLPEAALPIEDIIIELSGDISK